MLVKHRKRILLPKIPAVFLLLVFFASTAGRVRRISFRNSTGFLLLVILPDISRKDDIALLMELRHTTSNLINHIYQAATDATQLRPVLEAIAEEVGADVGVLAIGELASDDLNFTVITPSAFDSEHVREYIKSFRPWVQNVLKVDPERIYCHEDADLDLDGAVDCSELCDQYDIRSGFSAYFQLKKSGYVFLSLCRQKGRPGFDSLELESLKLLVPHIKQAFEINNYLDEITLLHDITQERYQQFSIGVLLLNDCGKVVFSNPVAKHLLNQPGGIYTKEGRLQSGNAEESAKLDKLIRLCIQTANIKGASKEGFLSISRAAAHKPPLSLSVSSYANKLNARTMSASNGRALVVVFDPERRQMTQEHILEHLYELTATEAALATSLAEGKTLTQVAMDNSVSRETLRSQLKRVFQKTHTKRQSELVKLVLTGPGSLVI